MYNFACFFVYNAYLRVNQILIIADGLGQAFHNGVFLLAVLHCRNIVAGQCGAEEPRLGKDLGVGNGSALSSLFGYSALFLLRA